MVFGRKKAVNVEVTWTEQDTGQKLSGDLIFLCGGRELRVGNTVTVVYNHMEPDSINPHLQSIAGTVNRRRTGGFWWFRGEATPELGAKLKVVGLLPDNDPDSYKQDA